MSPARTSSIGFSPPASRSSSSPESRGGVKPYMGFVPGSQEIEAHAPARECRWIGYADRCPIRPVDVEADQLEHPRSLLGREATERHAVRLRHERPLLGGQAFQIG